MSVWLIYLTVDGMSNDFLVFLKKYILYINKFKKSSLFVITATLIFFSLLEKMEYLKDSKGPSFTGLL